MYIQSLHPYHSTWGGLDIIGERAESMAAEGWTIHEAAEQMHLSECRVRQLIREKKLGATKVRGKYGPELRITPTIKALTPPSDNETLARMVLTQEQRIRYLEQFIHLEDMRGCG